MPTQRVLSLPALFTALAVASFASAGVSVARADQSISSAAAEQLVMKAGDSPRVMMMRVGPGMGGGELLDFDLQPRMLERMSEQLQLTPKQLGKLTEYSAEVRPQMQQMRQELAMQSRRLRELSPGAASYPADTADAAKKIGDLTARMAKQNAELRAKMWQELTPEQRSKWQGMQTERRIEMLDGGRQDGRKIRIERRFERRDQ